MISRLLLSTKGLPWRGLGNESFLAHRNGWCAEQFLLVLPKRPDEKRFVALNSVSKAQQSPALGEMMGLFTPPPRGRAALRCVFLQERRVLCSAWGNWTELRAEWSNSRTHCSRTDCSTLRPAGLGKKRQEKHEATWSHECISPQMLFSVSGVSHHWEPAGLRGWCCPAAHRPPVSAGAINEVDGSLAAFVLRYRPIPPPFRSGKRSLLAVTSPGHGAQPWEGGGRPGEVSGTAPGGSPRWKRVFGERSPRWTGTEETPRDWEPSPAPWWVIFCWKYPWVFASPPRASGYFCWVPWGEGAASCCECGWDSCAVGRQ